MSTDILDVREAEANRSVTRAIAICFLLFFLTVVAGQAVDNPDKPNGHPPCCPVEVSK